MGIQDAEITRFAPRRTNAHEPQDAERGPSFYHPWERHPVPAFPQHCLPPFLRDFAAYQGRVLGADVNAVAMAGLAVCSAALDHRFRLRLKRHTAWYVSPRLWVLLVGASSFKKSPILAAVTRHLFRIEVEAADDHAIALARWENAGKEADAAKPAEPLRLIVNDATSEAVGEILHRQERGVLVLQDEVSGFLAAMDKYSGSKGAGADRAFYLRAYNGGPLHNDRVGRGHRLIRNCSVSFLGGVQDCFRGDLGKLSKDGLLQRFAVVSMQPPSFPEDLADAGAELDYENFIRRMARLEPRDLVLSNAALAETEALHRHLFMLETKLEAGEAFASFIGKLPGFAGSLMLVLHLAADPRHEGSKEVSAETAKAAAEIVLGFVLPHGADFYERGADGGDLEDVQKLAAHVLVGDADRYTVSDLGSGVPRLRGRTVAEIVTVASRLETYGWWTEGPAKGGGIAWSLRPGLREALHEQRMAKREEAAAALSAYREARRG
jgi:hypothetical protein